MTLGQRQCDKIRIAAVPAKCAHANAQPEPFVPIRAPAAHDTSATEPFEPFPPAEVAAPATTPFQDPRPGAPAAPARRAHANRPARTLCTRVRPRPAPNRGARTLCTSPRRSARHPTRAAQPGGAPTHLRPDPSPHPPPSRGGGECSRPPWQELAPLRILVTMSEPASIAPAGPTLEATLTAWEQQLGGLERQATAVLRAARRLRKAAQEGAVAGFATAITAVRDDAAKLQEAVAQAANPPAIDAGEKFADGTFLAELAEAAAAASVTLVQRDGRITAYPVVLRLEPRDPRRAHRPQARAPHPPQLPGAATARNAAAAEPVQCAGVPRPPVQAPTRRSPRSRPGLAGEPARRRPAGRARRAARAADAAAGRGSGLSDGGVPVSICCAWTASPTPAPAAATGSNSAARPAPRAPSG